MKPYILRKPSGQKNGRRGMGTGLGTGLLGRLRRTNLSAASKHSDLSPDDLTVTNFVHQSSASINPNSPVGISGLPPAMQNMLEAVGIKKDMIAQNPKEARQVASLQEIGGVENVLHLKSIRGMQTIRNRMRNAARIITKDPFEQYEYDEITNKIGRGSFGNVYEVTCKETGEKYAMKVSSVKHIAVLDQEVKMHALCKGHKNIVTFVEAFRDVDQVYIVVELMKYGALTRFTHKLPPGVLWREKALVFVIREILRGLAFLHANNHLHRDIKSHNILVNKRGDVKLADFGFAVSITQEKKKRQTILGTPYWMAPEIFQQEYYDNRIDTWACGITAIEIAEGKPPHAGKGYPPPKLAFIILTNPAPAFKRIDRWSPELQHWLSKVLRKDPRDRPRATECLMHPVFESPRCCRRGTFSKLLTEILKIKERYKQERLEKKKIALL